VIQMPQAFCHLCEQFAPELFDNKIGPKSFYRKRTHEPDKKGYFALQKFRAHATSKSHLNALKLIRENSFSAKNLASSMDRAEGETFYKNDDPHFQRMSILFATLDETPAHVSSYAKMLRVAKKHPVRISANKIDAFTVVRAARNYLRSTQDEILEKSDCHALLLDDGNGVDIREWTALAMNADSFSSEPGRRENLNFFRGAPDNTIPNQYKRIFFQPPRRSCARKSPGPNFRQWQELAVSSPTIGPRSKCQSAKNSHILELISIPHFQGVKQLIPD